MRPRPDPIWVQTPSALSVGSRNPLVPISPVRLLLTAHPERQSYQSRLSRSRLAKQRHTLSNVSLCFSRIAPSRKLCFGPGAVRSPDRKF